MDFFLSPEFSRTALYFGIALPCAICDHETGRVPRAPLLLLIVLMLATSAASPFDASSFAASLSGAAVAITAFALVRKMTGGGLGLADVWMAGATGAFGGTGFWAESTMVAIVLILPRAFFLARSRTDKAIPFLPALIAGVFFSLIRAHFSGN